MPVSVYWSAYFSKLFDKVLSAYPHSKESVRTTINALPEAPEQGDIYPGINPHVRKTRIALKEYKIGKSGGLRLIFMALQALIVPVLIYAKRQEYKEGEIKNMVKTAQREILLEVRGDKPSSEE